MASLNFDDLFPSRYLKADDIGENDLVLTITSVAVEELQGTGGPEQKPVVYFQETDKSLVLNKTNGTTIASMFGHEIANWYGKKIALYATEVQFAGKTSLGLRVRLRPSKQQPALMPDAPASKPASKRTMPAPVPPEPEIPEDAWPEA